MKYFLDTEFHEFQKKFLFRKPVNTIELISIGIVAEDGREYYAISKDFDLKAAWNKWQPRTGCGDRNNIEPKEYWLRENVLKPIWQDLAFEEFKKSTQNVLDINLGNAKELYLENCIQFDCKFDFNTLKKLIDKYGKTNREICTEIMEFTLDIYGQKFIKWLEYTEDYFKYLQNSKSESVEFYAYYADLIGWYSVGCLVE